MILDSTRRRHFTQESLRPTERLNGTVQIDSDSGNWCGTEKATSIICILCTCNQSCSVPALKSTKHKSHFYKIAVAQMSKAKEGSDVNGRTIFAVEVGEWERRRFFLRLPVRLRPSPLPHSSAALQPPRGQMVRQRDHAVQDRNHTPAHEQAEVGARQTEQLKSASILSRQRN